MRKFAFVLTVVMVFMMLATPAAAVEPRMVTIIPEISFDGITALCEVTIAGNSMNEKMDATIRLYLGTTCVATWTATGNGYIFFNKTKTVIKGGTYTLTVSLSINGSPCSPVSVTGTC